MVDYFSEFNKHSNFYNDNENSLRNTNLKDTAFGPWANYNI